MLASYLQQEARESGRILLAPRSLFYSHSRYFPVLIPSQISNIQLLPVFVIWHTNQSYRATHPTNSDRKSVCVRRFLFDMHNTSWLGWAFAFDKVAFWLSLPHGTQKRNPGINWIIHACNNEALIPIFPIFFGKTSTVENSEGEGSGSPVRLLSNITSIRLFSLFPSCWRVTYPELGPFSGKSYANNVDDKRLISLSLVVLRVYFQSAQWKHFSSESRIGPHFSGKLDEMLPSLSRERKIQFANWKTGRVPFFGAEKCRAENMRQIWGELEVVHFPFL